jgi:hypothetical protein
MSQMALTRENNTESGLFDWKGLYRLAAVAALVIIVASMLDIIVTMFPWGATPDPGKASVTEWFSLIQANWFLGLRGLGLLNILTIGLATPVFLALLAVQRRHNLAFSGLALILVVIGATIYISNNSALSMLTLSRRYALATSEAEKAQLAAAGQMLLTRAEDFTPGAYAGFIFAEVGYLLAALVMLHSGQFGKATARVGLVGFALMIISTSWATFVPIYYDATVLMAMVGGLCCMAWFFLVARRLWRLARKGKKSADGR